MSPTVGNICVSTIVINNSGQQSDLDTSDRRESGTTNIPLAERTSQRYKISLTTSNDVFVQETDPLLYGV